ncbi:CBS domain-containing protein [Rhodoferax saidenbachensis]|uniref:Sugar kinase n=1 Tax=Rhodoferax saidenbachensis TaxID=1484693 RepID=A0A1P8KDT7_9BURK|nr:CBS domain-containing protein [Rhodoferax saidenbachensis]APW44193.1 sugar kinase [Rhodoferax saidenbachensis]
MKLDLFLISEGASLRDALQQIEANQHGIVLTTDLTGRVTGLATDGDVRRTLLDGAQLTAAIASCANPNFVWADAASPRELLLKQLDNRIHIIPLLDESRRLTGIVSRDYLPRQTEEPVYARARSPVRISFGGGGSDLTHFFEGDGGAVINTTISLYSHATLRKRDDEKIVIHSRDLDATLNASDLTHALVQKGPFGLIQAILKAIHPDFGFELYLHSDFPMNSGLGGSAVVSAVVLGCFNQFRQDRWDSHELAELAFQAERLYLGIAGGWQDQYATVFGGFNFMEFRMEQNIVHPLRIPSDVLLELEESLVLVDTSTPHDSGDIHQDQRTQMRQEAVRQKVQSNVDLTYRMRNHLLRGRLLQFGQALHEAWELKRQFSSKISNSRLDTIYSDALAHGALGGKLLGAGGGGFFLFYVTPFRKHELIANLESAGLKVRPFRFEQEGLRAWSARERKNHIESDNL